MSFHLLNLGCGRRFHPDWENLDCFPAAPSIRRHDLREGIPYPDQTFDVVYHSHVLEHLSKQEAPSFLRECHRILRPSGVIRVAVPDLEKIVRLYLEALEKASQGTPGWAENYEWMLLEMYDQAVRERSGGAFNEYYSQDPIPNWDFVYERGGAEAQAGVECLRKGQQKNEAGPPSLLSKLEYVLRNFSHFARNKILKTILGREDYQALQVGRFRRQGEVHQWMYDEYSLAHLLQAAGFLNPRRCAATESLIPNWAKYCLDNHPDGTAYKPDSMYLEALKP